MTQSATKTLSPGMRMAVDFGPLLVFFLVNFVSRGEQIGRVLAATAAFMVATGVAMAFSQWKAGRISPMLWMSGVLVLIFGGLTIYFHDETFIKVKPTIIYAMLSSILIFGLATGRPLLQSLLESAYPGLTAQGWRQLTINWAIYFVAMAIANEIVWRNFSWNFWVAYKLWGVIPLTFLFAAANLPMMLKHGLETDPAKTARPGDPPEQ
jgi:intracellular septation protein